MDAKRAETLGLVNRIFPSRVFSEEVRKIAVGMAQKPPLAMGMGKKIINQSFQQKDVKPGLQDAVDVQSILITTEDYQEGIKALKEKRAPVFQGR